MPLVLHYWVDLQSVHGSRCYGNITQMRNVSQYMLVLALCLVIIVLRHKVNGRFGNNVKALKEVVFLSLGTLLPSVL